MRRFSRLVLPAWCVLTVQSAFFGPAQAQTGSGHMFPTDSDAPISLNTDRLDIERDAGKIVLTGNVRVFQGPLSILSDTAELQNNPATGRVQKISIRGNVRIASQSGRRADGNWVVYEIDKYVITMGGTVALHQDGSILTGRKLVINTLTGIGTLTGGGINENTDPAGKPGGKNRVRGVLTPNRR